MRYGEDRNWYVEVMTSFPGFGVIEAYVELFIIALDIWLAILELNDRTNAYD